MWKSLKKLNIRVVSGDSDNISVRFIETLDQENAEAEVKRVRKWKIISACRVGEREVMSSKRLGFSLPIPAGAFEFCALVFIATMVLTLHHLNDSRSQRVLWLLVLSISIHRFSLSHNIMYRKSSRSRMKSRYTTGPRKCLLPQS